MFLSIAVLMRDASSSESHHIRSGKLRSSPVHLCELASILLRQSMNHRADISSDYRGAVVMIQTNNAFAESHYERSYDSRRTDVPQSGLRRSLSKSRIEPTCLGIKYLADSSAHLPKSDQPLRAWVLWANSRK